MTIRGLIKPSRYQSQDSGFKGPFSKWMKGEAVNRNIDRSDHHSPRSNRGPFSQAEPNRRELKLSALTTSRRPTALDRRDARTTYRGNPRLLFHDPGLHGQRASRFPDSQPTTFGDCRQANRVYTFALQRLEPESGRLIRYSGPN